MDYLSRIQILETSQIVKKLSSQR